MWLTRRQLIRGLALSAGAGAGVLNEANSMRQEAQGAVNGSSTPSVLRESRKLSVWTKFSKEVAGYFERGRDDIETCKMCHNFLDPNECVIVEGYISPTGWCNYGNTTG
jgi:hypothetical protein